MLILDMVHHNPGEPQTFSKFLEASALSSCNYNGQVWADYIQTAITYKYFDKDFLKGQTDLLNAIESRAANISRGIERDIASGIKAFFHPDVATSTCTLKFSCKKALGFSR